MAESSNVIKLTEILKGIRKDDGKEFRHVLFGACREIINQLGDDLDGFAIVAWDRRGEPRTAYHTGDGMVSSTLVPTFVGHALNRHVTLDMADAEAEALL